MQVFFKRLWIPLAIVVSSVYVPYMSGRPIRICGDDKVYVTQAYEMHTHGRYFLQTYADEPNYFKGPFHYLAVLFGVSVFGQNMLATVYMNYVLLLLGALAISALVQK